MMSQLHLPAAHGLAERDGWRLRRCSQPTVAVPSLSENARPGNSVSRDPLGEKAAGWMRRRRSNALRTISYPAVASTRPTGTPDTRAVVGRRVAAMPHLVAGTRPRRSARARRG